MSLKASIVEVKTILIMKDGEHDLVLSEGEWKEVERARYEWSKAQRLLEDRLNARG